MIGGPASAGKRISLFVVKLAVGALETALSNHANSVVTRWLAPKRVGGWWKPPPPRNNFIFCFLLPKS